MYGDMVMNERNMRKWCEMFNNKLINQHTELDQFGWEVFDYPPSPLQFRPCSQQFSVLHSAEIVPGWKQFGSDAQLKTTVNNWPNGQGAAKYDMGIQKLVDDVTNA